MSFHGKQCRNIKGGLMTRSLAKSRWGMLIWITSLCILGNFSWFYCLLTFFSKLTFSKNYSRNTIRWQKVRIQIRTRILSVNCCKFKIISRWQNLLLEGKELKGYIPLYLLARERSFKLDLLCFSHWISAITFLLLILVNCVRDESCREKLAPTSPSGS